jgi:hypothetical protein
MRGLALRVKSERQMKQHEVTGPQIGLIASTRATGAEA